MSMGEQTFAGLRVVVQEIPKMQLSERVCEVLAPDFIAEMNAWMHGFFGTHDCLRMGSTLVVNKRTYTALRQMASKKWTT